MGAFKVGCMPSGDIDVNIDEGALNAGMTRALFPWLVDVTSEVTAVAVVECPVGEPDPLGRAKGPHMRDRIRPHVEGTGHGMTGVVTAETTYALSVHEGARPHQIPLGGAAAQMGRGYPLRFSKDGQVRRPWSVQHPGNAANPFLRRALRIVIGRLQ